jgi:hypothetical protein
VTTSRTALRDLSAVLESARRSTSGATTGSGTWRWTVRQRLAGVRDLLVNQSTWHEDSWLAARGGAMLRERNALLARVSALGARVLQDADVAALDRDLRRLVVDVAHHLQRLHDLAYDEVEYELGGSE